VAARLTQFTKTSREMSCVSPFRLMSMSEPQTEIVCVLSAELAAHDTGTHSSLPENRISNVTREKNFRRTYRATVRSPCVGVGDEDEPELENKDGHWRSIRASKEKSPEPKIKTISDAMR